jgi:ribose transport system substrate-binding protein
VSEPTAAGTSNSSSSSSLNNGRPRTFSPLSVLIILVLAGVVLWMSGMFKGRPTVAIVTSGDGPYWEPVIKGATDAAAKNNVELRVVRSKSEKLTQSQLIQDLLKEQPAGIAVSPLDTKFQAAVLAEVAGQTTLVTFDSDSPVSRRLCFVGTDNYASGRLCADAVKAAVPEGGDVIICMGVRNKDNTRRRRQAIIDALLDKPVDPDTGELVEPVEDAATQPTTRPEHATAKYKVVATLADDGDRKKAVELASAALKDHPSVKCFVGLVSYSAPSVMQALKDANMQGKVKIVGFDIDERTLNGIESGDVYATVMQDQYGLGYNAVRIMAAEAYGNRGELPAFQAHLLPCTLVTKSNLADARKSGAGAAPLPASETQPTTAASTVAASGGEPETPSER